MERAKVWRWELPLAPRSRLVDVPHLSSRKDQRLVWLGWLSTGVGSSAERDGGGISLNDLLKSLASSEYVSSGEEFASLNKRAKQKGAWGGQWPSRCCCFSARFVCGLGLWFGQ